MDFGVELDGYYGDAALTVPVGRSRRQREKLLRVTRESLERGDRQGAARQPLDDVSAAVQQWVEKNGFSVVREFVGHGIGTKMHEDPQLPNYGERWTRAAPAGEAWAWAIEPMVNAGSPDVRVLERRVDRGHGEGSDSAHFEHTVAVTNNGPWILTRPREATGPVW